MLDAQDDGFDCLAVGETAKELFEAPNISGSTEKVGETSKKVEVPRRATEIVTQLEIEERNRKKEK